MTFRRFVAAAGLWLGVMAGAAHAQLVVTNVNDSGRGSLRQAINDANASCAVSPLPAPISISFALAGPFKIRPLSQLPTLTCPTTLDGYTQAGAAANTQTGGSTDATILVELDGSACGLPCAGLDVRANGVTINGLAIHSFGGPGIRFTNPANNFGFYNVNGNFIGTDTTGINALGNQGAGIDVVSGFITVGGLGAASRNLITANNGPGINIQSAGAFSVINNLIGGRRDGLGGVGNSGAGIASAATSFSNGVSGNYIRYNGGSGLLITGTARVNIQRNPSDFGNGGPGIDYTGTPPFAPPTVTSFVYDPVANTTTITAQAPASSLISPNVVDFYHNSAMPPFGEGELLVASANVDTTGVATATVPGQARFVTATFTGCGDGCFGTSPFALAAFPPTLGITFTPNPLNFGTTGTLTLVLQNPNKARQLGLVGFSFNLPAGLQIGVESAGADCAPGVSLAGASSTVAAASNVTLAPGSTCTITAPLTPTAAGTFNIAAGSISVPSDAGPGTNTAASLLVTTGAVQFSRASLAFPRQNVGSTSLPQSVTLTNIGNGALDISSIASSGDFGFTGCGVPLTLAPGASCVLSVTFSPLSNGTITGAITVTSNAVAGPAPLPLTGTGVNGPTPGISVQPFALGFGNVRAGSSATDHVTIFSTGSAPLSISGISISGGVFSQSSSCPAALPVGSSCDVTITYSPIATGSDTGQLSIQSNGDPPTVTVALSGSGVPLLPPTLSVDRAIDFGQQVVNTTARHALELRNTGELTLLVSGLDIAGAGFGLDGTCTSIPPGAACSVVVVFSPTSVGAFTGSLAIASNDPRGTVPVSLAGQGLAVPRAEIDVTPDGIGFASQMVITQSAGQDVTIRSTGTAPLHVTGVSVTGPFFVGSNTCAGTLAPGAQCRLSVGFLPLVPGLAQGQLTVASDAQAGRSFASLTGTGCRYYSIAGMRNLLRLCSP